MMYHPRVLSAISGFHHALILTTLFSTSVSLSPALSNIDKKILQNIINLGPSSTTSVHDPCWAAFTNLKREENFLFIDEKAARA
jgi:hypothetical protein